MHYFVDGYNFLFRSLHKGDNLAFERRELILSMERLAELKNLDLTLVFDGRFREGLSEKSHFGKLEILFSAFGETADELILAEVALSTHPRQETIVTSDRLLATKGRLLKANTLTSEAFLKQFIKKLPKKREKKQLEAPLERPPPPPQKESSYLTIFEERLKEEEKLHPVRPSPPSDLIRWLKAFEHAIKNDDTLF